MYAHTHRRTPPACIRTGRYTAARANTETAETQWVGGLGAEDTGLVPTLFKDTGTSPGLSFFICETGLMVPVQPTS